MSAEGPWTAVIPSPLLKGVPEVGIEPQIFAD